MKLNQWNKNQPQMANQMNSLNIEDDYGDPLRMKKQQTLRIFYQNIGGLHRTKNNIATHEVAQKNYNTQTYIFLFPEHNTKTAHKKMHKK